MNQKGNARLNPLDVFRGLKPPAASGRQTESFSAHSSTDSDPAPFTAVLAPVGAHGLGLREDVRGHGALELGLGGAGLEVEAGVERV